MDLFSPKPNCAICGQPVGRGKLKIAEKNVVCSTCLKATGLNAFEDIPKPFKQMTVEDIKSYIARNDKKTSDLDSFVPTKKIGTSIEFDDEHKKWLILSEVLGSRKKSTVYKYSDIIDFELLEDGESIVSGGLGRALVGGVLFGGAGAIVGGVTGKKKSKETCESLKIKITLKDMNTPVVYVNFLLSPVKKKGFLYKQAISEAHECLSTLQLICDQEKTPDVSSLSVADELLKFKSLLDADAITQEEYDAKKKELLGQISL